MYKIIIFRLTDLNFLEKKIKITTLHSSDSSHSSSKNNSMLKVIKANEKKRKVAVILLSRRQVAVVVANNEANIRYFILCRLDLNFEKLELRESLCENFTCTKFLIR